MHTSSAPGGGVDLDRRPILIFWESTRACGLACKHCRAEAQATPVHGELTTAEGLQLIDSLAAFGKPSPILIITGGDDRPTAPSTTTTSLAPGAKPTPTLPLDDTSIAAVNKLAGLHIPTDASGFLTTFPEARTQLDVSFTLPPDQVAAFVSGSGLAAPVAGTRVITHSSPLWKLNPEGTVAGVTDTTSGVARAVETVPEGDKVRVRIVLTPSA